MQVAAVLVQAGNVKEEALAVPRRVHEDVTNDERGPKRSRDMYRALGGGRRGQSGCKLCEDRCALSVQCLAVLPSVQITSALDEVERQPSNFGIQTTQATLGIRQRQVEGAIDILIAKDVGPPGDERCGNVCRRETLRHQFLGLGSDVVAGVVLVEARAINTHPRKGATDSRSAP